VLDLSLKLIVHHGSFMRQTVRGRSRVAGPDIILVHRFLKNEVEPRTYVLFTDAAVERLGIDPIAAGMERYTGKYAHFDEMACFVVSLDRWAAARASATDATRARSLLSNLTLGADPGAQHDPDAVAA
jgi:hypothetical protein